MAAVAVVIVNYRTPALALDALAAVARERTALPDLRAIVVDGGSGDGSAESIAQGIADPRFVGWAEPLALPINGGFGWANNQAILRLLQGTHPPDYIHLLNPDTVIEPGAIARLAAVLDAHPRCGAVGSQLIEADGRPVGSAFHDASVRDELFRGLKMGGLKARLGGKPWSAEMPAGEIDWVTGASVMFRSAALREAGLFDTGFFLYFEEVELMVRLRRHGWTIRHEPASRVAHVGGAATGVNATREADVRPPLPLFWYEARRRYLTLTLGRGRALLASLGFLAGHAVHRVRGSGGIRIEREGRGMLAAGVRPRARDAAPAFTPWDEPPGRPPHWMA